MRSAHPAPPASLPCSSSRVAATTTRRRHSQPMLRRSTKRLPPTPATGEHVTLRLGYFPNVTHATALVGVEQGIFADALGDDVTLETSTFNAGGEAVEALFADAIDATYIGPNPAINGFAKSDGEALRIVSGATSGGAFLVVKPEITSPADLAGTTHRIAGSWATPRTSRFVPGCRRTACRPTSRVVATSRSGPRRTPPRSTRSRPATSTARGSPSRGRRASSRRVAAPCSSTSVTCGPTGST